VLSKKGWLILRSREHFHGKPLQVSWELLGEGRKLAKTYGTKLAALVIGNNVSHLAKDAFTHGADKVYLVEDERLEDYRTQPYAIAMEQAVRAHKPESLLVGGTIRGRDFGLGGHLSKNRFDCRLYRIRC
jgi:electron transfer flavoprotein alpha subunit